MSSFTVLLLCIQACLIQAVFGAYLGGLGAAAPYGYGIGADIGPFGFNGAYGYGALGYNGACGYNGAFGYNGALGYGYGGVGCDAYEFGPYAAPYNYGCGAAYGGAGVGNCAVFGELPVGGSTAVAGQVPIIGAVQYGGVVPAAGAVKIVGDCACGCGYMY